MGAGKAGGARFQVAVLVGSFAVAVGLVATAKPAAAPGENASALQPNAPKPFDMLAFAQERISTQEDKKDVRCWSSFNKLQMFLTQCEFTEDVKAVRVEEHLRLLQSIWQEAQQRAPAGGYIPAEAVEAVLNRRFPQVSRDDTVQFGLKSGGSALSRLTGDDLRDYGDTIEPWRLIQAWAMRSLDPKGKLGITPQFDEKALHVLYRFLRAYDLVVLQAARDIAHEKRLSVIDATSISAAFRSGGVRP